MRCYWCSYKNGKFGLRPVSWGEHHVNMKAEVRVAYLMSRNVRSISKPSETRGKHIRAKYASDGGIYLSHRIAVQQGCCQLQ